MTIFLFWGKIMRKERKMLIDTHAHLTDKAFEGEEERIIKNAKDSTVEKIITSGYNLPSSLDAVKFCERHEDVYASIGIYPENIYELTDEVEKSLEELGRNNKVVAIGEIGLQYTEGMPDREAQKRGFVRQIKLAHALGKPIVIHCREAYGDTLEILKANKDYLTFGGTMHCFGGSEDVAKELIKLGLYISVGGVSTFKNAERLRGVLREVPLDKIILETDCPYLTPQPYRGRRNSPEYIPLIAENLAKIKGIGAEEVAIRTTENARRLFKI